MATPSLQDILDKEIGKSKKLAAESAVRLFTAIGECSDTGELHRLAKISNLDSPVARAIHQRLRVLADKVDVSV